MQPVAGRGVLSPTQPHLSAALPPTPPRLCEALSPTPPRLCGALPPTLQTLRTIADAAVLALAQAASCNWGPEPQTRDGLRF